MGAGGINEGLSERADGFVLAFAAGYVDTATFVQVSGLFSSHVTGNFVVFAAALVRGVKDTDWLKLIAFPVFIVGVALATMVYDSFRGQDRLLLALEAAILFCVGAAALAFSGGFIDGWLAMALVLAMACQNAGHRLHPEFGPVTTVMTTNVTKLIIATWRRLSGENIEVHLTEAESLFGLAASFGFGCALSAFITRALGLGSVLLPALLIGVLALRRMEMGHAR